MDIMLACDARPTNEQVRAYRFFERIGTNWVLLGSVPTNRFVITNVNVLAPHTYGVTASNVFGESNLSEPVIAPTDPRPPVNLNFISTSLIVPLPTTLVGSGDLVNWQEKLRLLSTTNGVRVTFIVQPREPVYFWKEWTSTIPPLPPSP